MTSHRTWQAQEAADYLSSVRGAQIRIQTIATAISDIYREIDGIKAIDYSGNNVRGGAYGDALEQLIAEKDERMVECQRQAHELECRVRRAVYFLGKMDDQSLAAILEAHYLNGQNWRQVARNMNFSESRLYDLRAKALEQFHEVMAERDLVDIPDARWPIKRDLRNIGVNRSIEPVMV